MIFLVTEFSYPKDLKPHVPPWQPTHPIQKTVVAPMEILFRDEIHKSETMNILMELVKDAALSGQPQVIIHLWVCTCTCLLVHMKSLVTIIHIGYQHITVHTCIYTCTHYTL
jgi:hypothetical protein